jgi:cytochrome c oxidase accessory protein FixG
MISTVVGIFLFTVVYGRLFCGWICPQTIFMEMVFRKIEYLIEGDWKQQIALNKSPVNGKKFFKKSLKHIIFYAISFIIGNTFLAYIIGVEALYKIITDPPSEHSAGLTGMLVFSTLFYIVFARLREQVCTLVCPYGRLQGVMLDRNSIVIAYDNVRGEPRGKIRKGADQSNLGDCIDCHLCVDVCPTGIDIRNGTQLECVNCTACIDACDNVMDKINKPRGLIRYASKNEIENKIRAILTPRATGYTVVLIILIILTTVLLLNRSDFELTILRTPGMLYQEQPDNKISNLYDLKIINKTFASMPASIELLNIQGEIKLVGSDLQIEPQGVEEGKFLVILSKDQIKALNTPLEIAVKSNDKIIDIIKTSFLGKVDKKGNNS